MAHATAQRPDARLPQEPTTFVGRVAELARLSEMLRNARLVTVTGTGGVGKTRLALRAAAQAEPLFPDGVRLIELSALSDPGLLANTVAAGLGLPEQDRRPRLEQVLDYLRERGLLLILDTCEHLIDACALFAEAVLAKTHRVVILATSREPLSVAGEHEFPLRPLAVPGADDRADGVRALRAAGDAVDLFAQRAADAVPGFRVTDANRADVVRLCRHLDGIPLAIELAAVRLRDLSLAELTERAVSRSLDLADGEHGPGDRHQTLRDTIGWSYELCSPAEQALWQRLSVFAGPFGLDAAEEVSADRGVGRGPGGGAGRGADPRASRGAVWDAVFGLVDKSVLVRAGADLSSFRMLDTIREYGAERLDASGAQSQARTRHLRRYLGMAAELAARPLERQVAQHQALRAEHADIRAALEYAATVPEAVPHPAAQLPADLLQYWVVSGRLEEGRYWLTRGLERAREPGPDRINALITRSFLAYHQGDVEPAIADAEAGTTLAADAGDRLLKARGLSCLAHALAAAGRSGDAKEAAKEARKLLGPDDDPVDLAVQLGILDAYLCLLTGELDGCLRHSQRALRLLPSSSGERWSSSYLYGIAGLALCLQGKAGEGNRAVLRGLAMKHELGDTVGVAHGLGVAALVAAKQQRYVRTAWLLGAAGPLWEQIGSLFDGVHVLQALTEQAEQEARAALGDDRYAEVAGDAAARPLDQVVGLAVEDIDLLPAPTRMVGPARDGAAE